MEEEIINGKVGVIKMSINNMYTENWIPVKGINNNMIILDNKQLVTGIKIQPRNIFILEENYRESIIDSFKTFYNLSVFIQRLIVLNYSLCYKGL